MTGKERRKGYRPTKADLIPEEAPPPLAGTRVVELGRFVAGPYAARLLGDLGADVVKVESPAGDPFRTFTHATESGFSPNFVALNRNKRSLALDLHHRRAQRMLFECLQHADVFIENNRPGVMERMGLGYEDLEAANPKLVYCSISGFGRKGPQAGRPGYDMIGQALSGLASQTIDPEKPRVMGPNTADSVTGQTAAIGIMAALLRQQATGRGQRLSVNLVASGLAFLGMEVQRYLDTDVIPGPFTRPANSLSFAFRCSDGQLLGLHLSSPEKFWAGLMRVLERPMLEADPRFANHHERQEHYEELHASLQAIFATGDRDTWVARLVAEDVPCAPILDVAEAYESEEIRAQELDQVLRGHRGETRTVAVPIEFGGSPQLPACAPPELGEHNTPILSELGYSEAEIEQAMQDGWLVRSNAAPT